MNIQCEYVFIIPAYNEERIIVDSLNLLLGFLSKEWVGKDKNWKIIVVDNNSNDSTREKCFSVQSANKDNLEYLFVPEQGRGNALRAVIQKISASFYLYIDADLPIELSDIQKLLFPIETGEADIVVGKRIGWRPLRRRFLTFGLRFVNRILFDLRLSDPQCGVKACSVKSLGDIIDECHEAGWFLDTELLIRSKNAGLRVVETPIHWIESRFSSRKSKVKLFKDSWNGLVAVWSIFLRVYPNVLRSLVFVVIAGSFIFILFLFQYIFISQDDFVVADRVPVLSMIIRNHLMISIAMIFLLWGFFQKIIATIHYRLFSILIVFFFLISAVIAIFTNPIHSQDLYWNVILVKHYALEGVNPYGSTIEMFLSDPATNLITHWRDLPMTHGPLWVNVLAIGARLSHGDFVLTLLFVKIVFLFSILRALVFFRKIVERYVLSNRDRLTCLAFFLLNPMVIQYALVEAHNDVLLLFFVTASCYFVLQKRYFESIVALLIGGLIKYIPWLFIPIPIIVLWRDKDHTLKEKVFLISAALILGLILFFVSYYPFGFGSINMAGVKNEIFTRGAFFGMAFPSLVFYYFMGLGYSEMRFFGVSLFILSMFLIMYFDRLKYFFKKKFTRANKFLLKLNVFSEDKIRAHDSGVDKMKLSFDRKILMAYTIPSLLLLFFGNPWFQPWYILWVFPLLIILSHKNFFLIVILSTFCLVVSDNFATLYASIFTFVFGVCFFFILKWYYFFRDGKG